MSGSIACNTNGDARCPVGRDCLGGLCVAPTETTCAPADDGIDGCDETSICVAGGSGSRCYPAPSCSDGACPRGSICNTVLPSKAAVCIPDRCVVDGDCASSSKTCVRAKTTDVVGHCESPSPVPLVGYNGAAAEGIPFGCPMEPKALIGNKPAGAACGTPEDCKPVCCWCNGGTTAMLAAQCDYSKGSGEIADESAGRCASAADACDHGAVGGLVCYPP